ncbi:hypothetical protein Mgra_00002844, partial [Meloidogyne graminicola]
ILREENWSKFQFCYKSKLDNDNIDSRIKLQNKISDYGRKCTKPKQHGIEMRVCSRRISFELEE